jgi:hypothetical protein
MGDPKVLARMRADWNERAGEDAHYYVAFGRRGQEEAEAAMPPSKSAAALVG